MYTTNKNITFFQFTDPFEIVPRINLIFVILHFLWSLKFKVIELFIELSKQRTFAETARRGLNWWTKKNQFKKALEY